MSRLKDAIDNVAADCGAGTKYSRIAHLFTEFLSMFFKFTRLSAARITLCYSEWHVAIVCRWSWSWHGRTFLFDDCDIASREYAFESCPFVSTFPPYNVLVCPNSKIQQPRTIIIHMFSHENAVILLQS